MQDHEGKKQQDWPALVSALACSSLVHFVPIPTSSDDAGENLIGENWQPQEMNVSVTRKRQDFNVNEVLMK